MVTDFSMNGSRFQRGDWNGGAFASGTLLAVTPYSAGRGKLDFERQMIL